MRYNCKNKARVTEQHSTATLREGMLPLFHYLAHALGLDPEQDTPATRAVLTRMHEAFDAWHARARLHGDAARGWMDASFRAAQRQAADAPTGAAAAAAAPGFTVEEARDLKAWLGDMCVGICDHGGGSMSVM